MPHKRRPMGGSPMAINGGSNDSGGESDAMNSDSDREHGRRSSSLVDAMSISSNGRSNSNSNSSTGNIHRFNANATATHTNGTITTTTTTTPLGRNSSFRRWRAMEHDDDEDDTGSSSNSSEDGGGSSDTLAFQQSRRTRRVAHPRGYWNRNNSSSNGNTTSGASSDNDQGRPPLVPASSKSSMLKDPGTPVAGTRWNAPSNLGPNATSTLPPQPDTPRALLVSQLRRSSLSSDLPMTPCGDGAHGGRSLYRIASLLRDESSPFEKEMAHEKVTTSLFKRIPPLNLPSPAEGNVSGSTSNPEEGGMVGVVSTGLSCSNPINASSVSGLAPDSPESGASANSVGAATQMYMDDYSDSAVAHPVRVSPIPNSQLKSPAIYISNSSRLNPENHFISSKHQELITSSPAMSPVNAVMGHMSPVALERRNKRKMSMDERFEPYKRHHRVPSSPSGNNSSSRSLSPGAPMLPSPTLSQQLFPPLRARSPSVSVIPSASSNQAVFNGSSNSPAVMNAMGIMIQGSNSHASNNMPAVGQAGTPTSLFHGPSASALVTLLNGGSNGNSGNGGNTYSMPPPQSMPVPIPYPATVNAIMSDNSSHQNHSQTHPPFSAESPRTYSQSPLAGSIAATGVNIVSNPPLSPRATAPFGQMLNLSSAQGEFSKMSISATEMTDN
ncbi:hypothetical protein SeLEV6574_g04054 [Synchytrium endobioticum]|nr:hypothetical protein SeLEV6574_g04054 [Synchytrium endobioticum]